MLVDVNPVVRRLTLHNISKIRKKRLSNKKSLMTRDIKYAKTKGGLKTCHMSPFWYTKQRFLLLFWVLIFIANV